MENIKKLFDELPEEEIVGLLLSTMEKHNSPNDIFEQEVIFVLEDKKFIEGVVVGTVEVKKKEGSSSFLLVHKKGLKRPREEEKNVDEQPAAKTQETNTTRKPLIDDE